MTPADRDPPQRPESLNPMNSSGGASPSRAHIWLDGSVVACACPTCGRPVSIRVWLMMGDCWHCGTSFSLSEDQQRQVEALLAVRPQSETDAYSVEPAPRLSHAEAPQPSNPQQANALLNRAFEPRGAPLQPTQEFAMPARGPLPSFPGGRVPAALKRGRVRQRLDNFKQHGYWHTLIRETSWDIRSALISAIVHLAIIILLGLWLIEIPHEEPFVILSELTTREEPREGDAAHSSVARMEPIDASKMEVPREAELSTPATTLAPDELAKIDAKIRELPVMGAMPSSLIDAGGATDMFRGRSPEARAYLLEKEGGTAVTEKAVAFGLQWIAAHQSDDGHWGLHDFHHAGDCRGRCSRTGAMSDTAGTGLALLAFLGAGQTQREGKYVDRVSRGLRWLVSSQGPDGDLRGTGSGNMYAHGIATIALCEALAMTKDKSLAPAARRAVDFIIKAQHSGGGWRYSPGEPGDTSVLGWQLMALRSARAAGINVPESPFERASIYLDSVQFSATEGRFAYMPGAFSNEAMTAEGLLSRLYAGWTPREPALQAGLRWLLDEHQPDADRLDIYYVYYATQVMHHVGSGDWNEWNAALQTALLETQETQGHEAGSWVSRGRHDASGGRLYMTALAVCTLEVYYRHLPLYREPPTR